MNNSKSKQSRSSATLQLQRAGDRADETSHGDTGGFLFNIISEYTYIRMDLHLVNSALECYIRTTLLRYPVYCTTTSTSRETSYHL